MIADGADIIDIGGESTRPGHTPVSAEEEAARVVPVIEALRKHFDVPISVDTYKGSVADVAVQAGADLVNDVWGLKYDPEMAGVIAKHDAACCLMHNREMIADEKVARVLAIYDSLGVREQAETAVERYTARATEALAALSVSGGRREPMERLALELTKRLS